MLDQRGIAERLLAQGRTAQVASFGSIPLDITDFPTRHNYGLALWQKDIERLLAAWVEELAIPIYRSREVTGFAQDDTGVDVELSDERRLRAEYLVGCDGGRSVVRKKAGIDLPGWDASTSYLIAEVQMTSEPALGIRRGKHGVNGIGRLDDGKTLRVVLCEQELRQGDEPTVEDLREALIAVYGTDYGVHDVTALSRSTDMTRQAASYRERRVLLAGDAAHVHSPHARSRPGHRRGAPAGVHSPAPRSTGAAQSRSARRPRRRSLGRSGGAGRRPLRWALGPSRSRRGRRAFSRAHPARRTRPVGRNRNGSGLVEALTTWFGAPGRG